MHSPPYPNAHLFIHTLHVFTMYRTAMGWPANKWIYKYVQNCTHRNNEREGNRNYPNGDLTKDVSTRSSTYVKTLTSKEKFPY